MVHDKIQEVLHSVQQVRIITEEKTGREVEHFLVRFHYLIPR